MSRGKRGKLPKLSHTKHRKQKQEHDDHTGRKGKLWAKKHVQKESASEDLTRMAAEREQRRREQSQIVILPAVESDTPEQ